MKYFIDIDFYTSINTIDQFSILESNESGRVLSSPVATGIRTRRSERIEGKQDHKTQENRNEIAEEKK